MNSQVSVTSRLSMLFQGFPKGLMLFFFGTIIAIGSLIWKRHEDALQHAEMNSTNLAWVLESRLDASLHHVDADLLKLAFLLSAEMEEGKAPQRLAQSMDKLFVEYVRLFDEIRAINFFDASGNVRYSSTGKLSFSIADREHFKQLSAHSDVDLVFSSVMAARTDGKSTFVVARAVRDRHGKLLGVLTALVDLGQFSRLLASVDLGSNGIIAIRRSDDARLVLRRPEAPELINQPINYAIRDRILGGDKAGVEYLQAPGDKITRIAAFRTLESYPFYVVVATSKADVLAEWRSTSMVIGLLTLVLLGIAGVLSFRVARSERNFRTFFDTMDDYKFVFDDDLIIKHVNDIALHRLGYKKTALLGSSILNIHSGEHRAKIAHYVSEMLAGRMKYCTVPLVCADGSLLPVEARLVRGYWNNASAVFGVCRDISERIRNQQALEEESFRRRLVLERSRDGICLVRNDGSVAEFNPAFMNMLGYSLEEFAELKIWDWDMQLGREKISAIVHDMDLQYLNIETRHKRKNGQEYDVEVSISRVELGQEKYLFCLHRDVTEKKRVEMALRQSEQQFRHFFEKNSSVMLLIDPVTTQIVNVNQAALAFYGYSLEQMQGMLIERINMSPLAILLEGAQKVLSERKNHFIEEAQKVLSERKNHFLFQHRLASGEIRDVESYLTPIINQGRQLIFSVVLDVTERKRDEAQLRLAATVFSHAREGILITAPDGSILDVNDTFTQITGYRYEEVLGKNPKLLHSGCQTRAFYEAMWSELDQKGYWSGELWNRRKNGEIYAEMLTISVVRDEEGKTRQYVALFSDITKIKEHENQLQHLAHYDFLTKLPNRALLGDRLQQAMAQALRRKRLLAVIYLDLDGFKAVNDHYGHKAGDQLLIAVSLRMKEALRDGDTLARLGGDEFVAVLHDLSDQETSVPVVQRLLDAATQAIDYEGHQLQVSASLGVTYFPQAADIEADQLVRQADQAMYQAKQAGKNCYRLF